MTGLGLDDESVRTSPLLALLPTIIEAQSTVSDGVEGLVLVDGTEMVESVFKAAASAEYGRELEVLGTAVSATGRSLAFGRLERALVRSGRSEGGGLNSTVSIGLAPWPPAYVLRHVATNVGLVLVNSVNCGYLDMATNFLRAAQKVAADTKVSHALHQLIFYEHRCRWNLASGTPAGKRLRRLSSWVEDQWFRFGEG